MRRRFVQIKGELVEVTNESNAPLSPMIQPDINPYRSMVDGTMIDGRKAHREHLRKHGVREVGNDALAMTKPRIPDSSTRKELIRAQVDAMPDRQFRQALKKDIDFVKWNSRR